MTTRAQDLAIDLDQALQVKKIVAVWKKAVRTGLRSQPIEDLHDFLDIHRNIEAFANRLRQDVLAGRYRPASPEFVHLEKRDGIPRRLAVPEPADALLLQCVVEAIEPAVKEGQRSKNVYYSRSHMPGSVEHVDGTFAYPWWILWPEFQERIWNFTASHPFLVVTDIANYFDCIPLAALRNTLAELGHFNENILNFLFFLLENFCWRPYYIPSAGVGLPQINFDAPRLLAHAYLFRIDRELERITRGSFVRWMDDIDAGVSSIQEGKRLLRDLEIVLNSQGIRLNTGKSRILKAQDAVAHFWIQENRALTIIANSIKNGANSPSSQSAQQKQARERFRRFRRKKVIGQWEKVYKRYLSLFGMLGDPSLEKYLGSLLEDIPSLRGAALRYLQVLGPSRRRLKMIESFLTSGHCEDEASLFAAVKCLIAWETPQKGALVNQIVSLAKALAKPGGRYSAPGIAAGIWLLSKYGRISELSELILNSRSVWEKSSWLGRQVAAVAPLLPDHLHRTISETAAKNGLTQALQVLANLSSIKELPKMDRQLESYLCHDPGPSHAYPLPKVIIAKALLNGNLPGKAKDQLRSKLAEFLRDARYEVILLDSRTVD